ncbi:MAG: response regulator, partial [Pseudobdellovibrionaceae bacterium]
MSILIVDDENGTRQALRELLDSLNYRGILEAKNGKEALEIVNSEKSKLDLIISDWEMPHMDGISLLAELSKEKDTAGIPFLLITSDVSKKQIEEWKKSYPRLNNYLIKPFQRSALQKAIIEAVQDNLRIRNEFWVLSGASDLKIDEKIEDSMG